MERFLRDAYLWCQDGLESEIVAHHNHKVRLTWRFRELKWTEEGITPGDSAAHRAHRGYPCRLEFPILVPEEVA